MTNFAEQILAILTIENAQEWNETSEKFLFVADRIEACNLRATQTRVEYVEDKFEELLEA